LEIYVFIFVCYVKAWFTYPLSAKAPNQDLQFIKYLKSIETIDKYIPKVSIKKICHNLWYLSEKTAALSYFDDCKPLETKHQMVTFFLK
jgi:hypothetical protein